MGDEVEPRRNFIEENAFQEKLRRIKKKIGERIMSQIEKIKLFLNRLSKKCEMRIWIIPCPLLWDARFQMYVMG